MASTPITMEAAWPVLQARDEFLSGTEIREVDVAV
jgi:hypothetical protein